MAIEAVANLPISLSYSQLCVFDPELENPFNDWTSQHLTQGFSWRPGSVSFATTFDGGECSCVVETSSDVVSLDSALLVIAVPFDVPAHGRVEIGSVMGGTLATIPAGRYRMVFFDYGEASRSFRLVFTPDENPTPAVLRAYENVRQQGEYLLSALPA